MPRLRNETAKAYSLDLAQYTVDWVPEHGNKGLAHYLLRHGLSHIIAELGIEPAQERMLSLPYLDQLITKTDSITAYHFSEACQLAERKEEYLQKAEEFLKEELGESYSKELPERIPGKWGFIDTSGNEITAAKYDQVAEFFPNFVKTAINTKWGVIDKLGNQIIPCVYDEVIYQPEGVLPPSWLAKVELSEKQGIVSVSGQTVVSCRYDRIDQFINGFAKVTIARKWGFINEAGKEVIPCKYESARNFSDGLAAVKLDSKWGFINSLDELIVPYIYDGAASFSEGLANVQLENKYGSRYGLIDKDGNEVTPCIYNELDDYVNAIARVERGRYQPSTPIEEEAVLQGMELQSKYGFINRQGQEFISCKYEYVSEFNEGLAVIQVAGKYGFINEAENIVIPCIYEEAEPFIDGLAKVMLDNRFGLINQSGEIIVEFKYDEIWAYSKNIAKVRTESKYGFIDNTGKEIVACKYDGADSFNESGKSNIRQLHKDGSIDNLAAVALGGKIGFLDRSGHETIPCIYSSIHYYNDIAIVEKDGNRSYVNCSGKKLTDVNYKMCWPFTNGLAKVYNGLYGFIDKTGKEVIPCSLIRSASFANNIAPAIDKAGNSVLINTNGKEVCKVEYETVIPIADTLLAFKANDQHKDNSISSSIKCKEFDYLASAIEKCVAFLAECTWYTEGCELASKLAGLQSRLCGDFNRRTLNSYRILAKFYHSLNNYKSAEMYYLRVILQQEKFFGNLDEDTLESYSDYADFLCSHKKYLIDIMEEDLYNPNKTEGYFLSSLHGYEKKYGKNNASTLRNYRRYANFLADEGRNEKANHFFQLAINGFEKLFGETDYETLQSYNVYACFLSQSLEDSKAQHYFEEAKTGMESSLGPNHLMTLKCYNNYAIHSTKESKYMEAEKYHQKAIAGLESLLGTNSKTTNIGYNNYAIYLNTINEDEKAREFFEKSGWIGDIIFLT